jgi:hypothetical protein
MASSLACVTGQFPFLRERVVDVFEHDEAFRDLCSEYQACLDALVRFGGGDASAEPLRKEYAALRLRLEAEMLLILRGGPREGAS